MRRVSSDHFPSTGCQNKCTRHFLDNSPHKLWIATCAFFKDTGECIHEIIPKETIDLIKCHNTLILRCYGSKEMLGALRVIGGYAIQQKAIYAYLDSFWLNRTKLQIHDGTTVLCAVILSKSRRKCQFKEAWLGLWRSGK